MEEGADMEALGETLEVDMAAPVEVGVVMAAAALVVVVDMVCIADGDLVIIACNS